MTAFQWPNTLRSDSFLRVTELLSEGPIEGFMTPDAPAKSIYFDQTPLQNENGTMNFLGVNHAFRSGENVQDPLPGPSTAETTIAVETRVRYNIGPVVRTIVDDNVTSVRCMARIPALMQQDAQGNVLPFGIVFFYDVKPAGGDWTLAGTVNLPGQKCTSPFTIATTFALPGTGPWDIRMRRGTIDWSEVSTWYSDESWWESYTEIVEAKLSYPNSALVWVEVNAAQFGESSLPSRFYHLRGLKVQVPANYDPFTRTYSGLWDGTFKLSWTNNPAWLFREMIVNDRFGLGQFIDAAKVDKWSLYQIAQYCDQLVPNGYGGSEPRYVVNTQIVTRQEAFKLLQQITTAWRGMGYWSLGQVYAIADMPADPVKLVAPADVIEGHFKYSGTSLKTRHSVALVTWNDPEDFYRTAIEVVINKDQFEKFGWREINITAFGCTSRGAAHRFGKWALDTEQFATETVQYTASWDHADVKPGDIVSIADPRKANARIGGRVVSTTSSTVTIDGDFAPGAGENYQFNVELPDGAIETHPINSFTGRVLHLASNFSTAPQVGAMWAITGTDVNPRQYRVLSNTENEANHFQITALEHDPTKYARVEDGISLTPIAYSRPNSTIKPVSNVTAVESLYIVDGAAHSRISLSWTPGDDFQSVKFSVSAIGPDGFQDYGTVKQTNVDINDTRSGTYTFTVTAYNSKNMASTPTVFTYEAKGWAGVEGPYVSHLEITKGGPNNTFSGKDCRIDWQNNFPGSTTQVAESTSAGAGQKNPQYRDNVVRVYDPDTDTLLRTDVVTDTFYTYTYENNTKDNSIFNRGPQRKFKIAVTVRDNLGRESKPATISPENPVPQVIIPTLIGGTGQIFLQYILPDDPDFVGAIVWASQSESFDPLTTTPIYDGINNAISFDAEQFKTYYVRIAGYDQFNKFNLNISPAIAVVVNGTIIDTTPPEIPTGLVLTPTVETSETGDIISILTANWDVSPSDNFSYFDIQIKQAGGDWISFQTSTPTYEWRGVVPNTIYTVQVRAISANGYPSDFTLSADATTAKKTTPPAKILHLGGSSSLQAIYLTWSLPLDPDVAYTEVWNNTVNDLATALEVGTSSGTGFTHSGLTSGETYHYWVRAVNTSGLWGDWSDPATITVGKVQSVDIAPLAIQTPHIDDVAITAAKLADAAVTTTKLVDSVVTTPKIAPLAVTTTTIDAGAITTPKLGDAAVTTVKLVDNAVTTVKIGDLSITAPKIGDAAVTTAKIIDDAITTVKIADAAVTASELAAAAVITPKLADGAITTVKISDQAVTATQLAPNSVTTSKLVDTSITTAKIAALAITTPLIAPLAITTPLINNGAITATQIADATITGAKIGADQITNVQIAPLTITPVEIAAGAITTTKMASFSFANNLIPNSDFEEASSGIGAGHLPDGWAININNGGGDVFVEDASSHPTLSGARFLTLNRGTNSVSVIGVAYIPVQAGGTYELAAWMFGDTATSSSFFISVNEYDNVKALITRQDNEKPLTTSWARYNHIFTLSSTTKYVRVEFINWTTGTTQYAHIDNVSFKQQISGDLIATGAITASQLADGTITADKFAAGALGGATIDAGSVTTSKIADGAITTDKLAANSITAAQIVAGTITADKFAAGAIGAASIDAGSITTAMLGANIVTANKIAANTITANEIAANTITASQIAASTITANQIASGTITATQIAANTITAGQIAANTITASQIAALTITAAQIAANTITAGKLVAATITSNEIAANTIVAGNIAAGAITTAKLAANAVTANEIAANTITAGKIAAGTITATEIAAGTITANKIATGTITANEIAAGTITASQIAAGTITADRFAAGAISTASLEAGSVTTDKLAANAVTADKIAANTITAAQIATGTLTADLIQAGTITADKFAAGAVSTASLTAGSVTTDKLAANAVTADKIAANTITASQIAANTITASQIAASTITASVIASGTILAGNIAANTITTNQIAAGTITAFNIAANTITAGQIAANTITATQIAANTITANQIQAGSITSNEIQTGAITASKLTIASFASNLVTNGDFEEFTGALATPGVLPAGWTLSGAANGGSAWAEGTSFHSTVSGNRIVTLDRGTSGGQAVMISNGFTLIESSTPYEYTLYACADGGSSNGLYVRLHQYDSSQAYIGGTDVVSNGAVASADNWTKYGGVVTTASNAKYARFEIYNFQSSAQYFHIDSVSFRKQIGTTMITANAITSSLIAANAVQAANIAANAITSEKILAQAITADKIAANSITASQIAANTITANQIAAGTITATQIQAGSITGDRIQAGSINADRLQVSSQLPSSIFVGNTGVTIGQVQSAADSAAATASTAQNTANSASTAASSAQSTANTAASTASAAQSTANSANSTATTANSTANTALSNSNDPAPRINAASTLIDPGKIQISGSTTLSSWRNGGDNTKIEGGSIAANTITANKLTIGSRMIDFLSFQWTYSGNTLSWNGGYIAWIDDNGNNQFSGITGGSTTFTGSILYLAWHKGDGNISVDTNPFVGADYVKVGTYWGGSNINIYYGRTQIDGDKITTGTISAQQIRTDQAVITVSAQINNATITNAHLAGNISFDKMIGGTLTTTQAVKIGGDRFQLNATQQNAVIHDGTRNRVVLGGDGSGNYGIWIWDNSGNLVFGSGGAQNVPINNITGWPLNSSNISTYIANAAIQDAQINSLSASKISASSLSAINANLGTVTAGVAKSSDDRFHIDLSGGYLVISD
jgi:predicted phage tail protein